VLSRHRLYMIYTLSCNVAVPAVETSAEGGDTDTSHTTMSDRAGVVLSPGSSSSISVSFSSPSHGDDFIGSSLSHVGFSSPAASAASQVDSPRIQTELSPIGPHADGPVDPTGELLTLVTSIFGISVAWVGTGNPVPSFNLT